MFAIMFGAWIAALLAKFTPFGFMAGEAPPKNAGFVIFVGFTMGEFCNEDAMGIALNDDCRFAALKTASDGNIRGPDTIGLFTVLVAVLDCTGIMF
jgi:hypothetical protein